MTVTIQYNPIHQVHFVDCFTKLYKEFLEIDSREPNAAAGVTAHIHKKLYLWPRKVYQGNWSSENNATIKIANGRFSSLYINILKDNLFAV